MKKKKLSAKFILIGMTALFVFTSCKKDFQEETQKPNDISALVSHKPEQAFPGKTGETVKTFYNGQEIYLEKKEGAYVWMGDIAFDQSTFDSLKLAETLHSRTFKPTFNNQWLPGLVYYNIDPSFSVSEKSEIAAAISNWESNTSLRFIVRTSTAQWDYVYIRKGASGTGFYSDFIGKKGGQQIINLEPGFDAGVAIHEIGHAIGFYHEQCRTDRSSSILVNFNNMQPGVNVAYQFQTYAQTGEAGSQIGAFDFNSIMMYGSYDYSGNGLPTITRLDGSTFFSNRSSLSAGDIETANFIYGPPFARLELVNVVNIDEFGTDTRDIYKQDDVYVRLYSDAACTIPYTTSTDFTFNTSFYHYVGGNVQAPYYPSAAIVPAGSNSVLLNENLVTRNFHSDYGNVTVDEESFYFPLSAFFR